MYSLATATMPVFWCKQRARNLETGEEFEFTSISRSMPVGECIPAEYVCDFQIKPPFEVIARGQASGVVFVTEPVYRWSFHLQELSDDEIMDMDNVFDEDVAPECWGVKPCPN